MVVCKEVGEVRDGRASEIPKGLALLTPRFVSGIIKSIKYGEYFQVHPFAWNPTTYCIEVIQSSGRLSLYYFNSYEPSYGISGGIR
ncbi:unnamed protein product, partial [Allacma fusca]